jgi:hypothetical protein
VVALAPVDKGPRSPWPIEKRIPSWTSTAFIAQGQEFSAHMTRGLDFPWLSCQWLSSWKDIP